MCDACVTSLYRQTYLSTRNGVRGHINIIYSSMTLQGFADIRMETMPGKTKSISKKKMEHAQPLYMTHFMSGNFLPWNVHE